MSLHPLVGIPACVKQIEKHRFHAAGQKYVWAVAEGAACQPVIIPALGDHYDVDVMLARFDGILVTGSVSNVEPRHYQGPESRRPDLHDPERDATTLPLIRRAVAAGVPLLAICRGIQELNVAYGGSLHQHVQELPGKLDHRSPRGEEDLDILYGLAHEIEIRPGGPLAAIAGATRLKVNSLHGQGIDRPGQGLTVEARAPDGIVEAVSVDNAPGFALGIQWHPEYKYWENEFGRALFKAFGDACRTFAEARRARTAVGRVA